MNEKAREKKEEAIVNNEENSLLNLLRMEKHSCSIKQSVSFMTKDVNNESDLIPHVIDCIIQRLSRM